MGMNDHDNETQPQPVEPPREVSLTNDSLMNGEADAQGQNRPGQNRVEQSAGHRPKRRVTRRKIRVELIKEPERPDEEQVDAMSDESGTETPQVPVSMPSDVVSPPQTVGLPASGSAYAAASAPAAAGGTPGVVTSDPTAKVFTQSDNRLHINDLSQMSMPDLRGLASKMGVNHEALISMKKQEIIFQILKAHTEKGGAIYAFGALEILPDGYGFLRSPNYSYLPGPDDIYISPSQIRLFNLKTGDTVAGQIRSPKEGERFFAMLRVETVNFDPPLVAQTRIPFDNLTPLYPDEKLNLETITEEISTRSHRLAATDREDDPDAEDRQRDHCKPSRSVRDRPADRRAA